MTLTDVLGREVAVVADGVATKLQHTTYNTTGLAKGIYLLRVLSGEETITRKIEIQ